MRLVTYPKVPRVGVGDFNTVPLFSHVSSRYLPTLQIGRVGIHTYIGRPKKR